MMRLIRIIPVLSAALLLTSCSALRHEYKTIAIHADSFREQVREGRRTGSELIGYYDRHLAPYFVQFDSSTHAEIRTLLADAPDAPPGTFTARNVTLLLHRAAYRKALEAVNHLPEPVLQAESFQQLNYLYRFLDPYVAEVSAWSGRSDLAGESRFQLSRLKIFPFSTSSQKAVAAFTGCLLKAFVLDLHRQLSAFERADSTDKPLNWTLCTLQYGSIAPHIGTPQYRAGLDSMFASPYAAADIPAIRRLLARALPAAVERVSVDVAF